MREKAILVVFDQDNTEKEKAAALEELKELSKAAGLQTLRHFMCPLREPNARFFIGRGKAEEIAESAKKLEARVVIFDTDLSSTQQRNLEEIIDAKTIDRTQLILDIFALRARSTEGKLQVELAQLQYLLPRLGGQGIALSRLGGGVGTRGPGEQKLEVDRRRLREKISKLGIEIERAQGRRKTAIEKKKEKDLPLVALAGYTNAGKSTLFNKLTSAGVLVKNQLFSTLDTTTRILTLPGNQKVFLADTVGFVRRLPHHLVESFKATLEEAVQADILLHVIDAHSSDVPGDMEAVNNVLNQIDVLNENVHFVFNKIDLLEKPVLSFLEMKWKGPKTHFISALSGEGVDELLTELSRCLPRPRTEKVYFIPKTAWNLIHWLYEQGEVMERKDKPEGCEIRVKLTEKNYRWFEKKLALSL